MELMFKKEKYKYIVPERVVALLKNIIIKNI